SRKFDELMGGPPRERESQLGQREMDLALAVQIITEKAMIAMARHVKKMTNAKYLCMAGGVALNCVGNGKLLREKIFDDIFIQPAAGDAGGALGVALAIWHRYLGKPRSPTPDGRDRMKGAFLGPKPNDVEIKKWLDQKGYPYTEYSYEELPKALA